VWFTNGRDQVEPAHALLVASQPVVVVEAVDRLQVSVCVDLGGLGLGFIVAAHLAVVALAVIVRVLSVQVLGQRALVLVHTVLVEVVVDLFFVECFE
jgi:hypothetical protein